MNRIFFPAVFFLIIACNSNDTPESDASPAADSLQYQWAVLPFTKVDSANPILGPGQGEFTCPILQKKIKWENKDVFNPAVVVREGKVWMLYRAEDTIGKYAGTSRLGLAVSSDGLHFDRMPEPVFFPGNDSLKKYEWEGGCEDPRVVEDSAGRYILTYTSYDGDKARLMVATSTDLRKWEKHGPAFPFIFLK